MKKSFHFITFISLTTICVNSSNSAPITQEQADRISAAANLVLLQSRNRANIEESINALGRPSHVITTASEIDLIDEGASIALAWDHNGCIYSYLTFDKSGRVRGAEALGKGFSSQMNNKYDFLRPTCPDSSYEIQAKRYKKFACSNAKPHKYCNISKSTQLRNTAIDRRAIVDSPEHKEKVRAQFSAWDGSHRGLENVIKSKMHNPSSYKHVETQYLDKGDYLIVSTKFRGKNAFGATVLNTMRGKG
ncbi:MAG: hypothetical protein ACYC5S_02195 [Thiobacillus sp.]